MKYFINILAVIALTSCTINRQNPYDPDVALIFQPAMYMQVAEDDVERYPTDQSFGISAWSLPDESSWTECAADAVEFFSSFEAAPVDELRWSCGEEILWPSVTENLTFIAWAPNEAGCGCRKTEGVTFEVDNVLEDQTDLLYTEPLQDMSKLECGGVVTVPFRHALCQISLCVKNRVAADEKITVKSLKIDEIAVSGTFSSLKTPQWRTGGQSASVAFFDGNFVTGPLPELIGSKWLMIPQEMETSLTVEYDFTTASGETITQRLKTIPLKMPLEAGRSYTLTLSVGIDDVKFLKEIIKDRFLK